MIRHYRHIVIPLILLSTLILISFSGCTGNQPGPKEVIASARDAVKEIETYRVEIKNVRTQNGEMTESSFLIEFVLPDHIQQIPLPEDGQISNIWIGNTEYRWDNDKQSYEVIQWSDTFGPRIQNIAASLIESLDLLIELIQMEEEDIDGVNCYHYKGSIDTDAILEKQKANLDPLQLGYQGLLGTIEQQHQWQCEYEFWVGKDDYLLRQVKQYSEVILIRDAGSETEREERHNAIMTFHLFDFNESIEIEPPASELVEGVNLVFNSTSSIGGKDIQHQEITFKITVSNRGMETARDVRVFLGTSGTNQGFQTMEAEPSDKPVNLKPDEYETYLVNWEYDMSKSSKQVVADLMNKYIIRAKWIDGNGQQHEELMISDTPGGHSTSGWAKTFGGNRDDHAEVVKQTQDGGYIIAGLTSYGTDKPDVYLIKVDTDGNEQWSKSIGSSYDEQTKAIQLTADGGYIITGWIFVPEPDWHTDVYLLKTDATGNELWTKTFGGNDSDSADSVQQTDDGGYIIAGKTKTDDKRFFSIYLIKTDADGNELWSRTYSDSEDSADTAYSVQSTADGGYITAGYTSIMGPEVGNIYVIKTDEKGNELWSRKFGGNDDSHSTSMQCTSDDGYIITGWRDNNGGLGTSEIILLKIDADGNEIWYKTYDEIYGWAADVKQTPDGGYIIAATLYSGEIGGSDTAAIDANGCLIKTDSKGNMLWLRKLGSNSAEAIELTKDGGYIVAGFKTSWDGSNNDAYVVKTDSSGNFRLEDD